MCVMYIINHVHIINQEDTDNHIPPGNIVHPAPWCRVMASAPCCGADVVTVALMLLYSDSLLYVTKFT